MSHGFLASTTAGNSASTSLVVTKPAGVVDGAHMVLTAYAETATALAITGSWTAVHDTPQPSGSTFQQYTWVRIASSEPASWTISWGGASVWRTAGFMAFSGGDPTTIQDATATENSGTGTAVTGLSLTTATNGALLLLAEADFTGTTDARSAYSSPLSTTNEIDFGNVAMAYGSQDTKGASGNKAATLAGSAAWTAHLLALRAVSLGIGGASAAWDFPHPPIRTA